MSALSGTGFPLITGKKRKKKINIKQTAEDVKKDSASESDKQNYEAERTAEFSKLEGGSREL